MATIEKIKNGNHQLRLDFKPDGTSWMFDNGQYGEIVKNEYAQIYSLTYFYNRVYVSSARVNTNFQRFDSCNAPLNTKSDEVKELVKSIFIMDKQAGIIPAEYPFV